MVVRRRKSGIKVVWWCIKGGVVGCIIGTIVVLATITGCIVVCNSIIAAPVIVGLIGGHIVVRLPKCIGHRVVGLGGHIVVKRPNCGHKVGLGGHKVVNRPNCGHNVAGRIS